METSRELSIGWKKVLDAIRSRISEKQFETWFSHTNCSEFDPERLVIDVPNSFYSAWLKKQYGEIIREAVEEAIGSACPALEFHIDESLKVDESLELLGRADEGGQQEVIREIVPRRKSKNSPRDINTQLNQDYTFDNFVVGPSNRMSHAAALAVIEDPGRVYNPLFIHGGLGLGKTHLLQGVCHELLARDPDLRMEYVPCEQFVNEFIAALEKNRIEDFRERYRELDVLVIDDIHFLANKDHTQEEFFHTFNRLYNDHKQIILSSDSPPRDIPTLEDRLVSRFRWGMVCAIEPPTFETRLAIIRKKCRRMKTELDDEVGEFLASSLKGSIRELEGAVTRFIGFARLMQRPLDVATANEALGDLLGSSRRRVTIDEIVSQVTDHYGVRLSDLQSKKRFQSITLPRQICMYLARKYTSHSLAEIGGYFGGRDHSTVLHATDKIGKSLKNDPEVRDAVAEFCRHLDAQA
ncbi:MAG: chromosomal replication initiator protein DnaA [Planctomycetes bacterium]|nr:chromosomal replication initiator protein DnaA [Planctomycetota bacterium]